MAGALSAMIAAIFSGGVTSDPFFEYTTLLLPGNGTNGAQNNTFLDGSTNNFTITRNGNTTQGTFSPFSQTGWGAYFDGTNDYLTSASNADYNLGTTFSVEGWIYSQAATKQVLANLSGFVYIIEGNGTLNFYNGSSLFGGSGATVSRNTWVHVVFTRDASNVVRGFVNGVLTWATTVSTGTSQTAVFIGSEGGTQSFVNGYLSNVRIVKGAIPTSYQTSSTTAGTTIFTPPTSALTAISGTSLLTCQSNRFVDNSTTPKTITPTNGPTVVAFSPFNPSASWSAATYGGSGYFDGSGDYLQLATNTLLNVGTSDFSVEFYIYCTTTSASNQVIFASQSNGLTIYRTNQSGTNYIAVGQFGGATVFTGATQLSLFSWNHVAVTRSGSVNRLFINGVLDAYNGSSLINFTNTNVVQICADGAGTQVNAGYLSNFRLIKNSIPTSYQTSATTVGTQIFTPPQSPLTTTSEGAVSANVNLLLNFTNAGIYDATSKNDLETVGVAAISTAQKKFAPSSMYFDGSNSNLSVPSNITTTNLTSGDFTIELWFYCTAFTAGAQQVFSKDGVDAVSYAQYAMTIGTAGQLLFRLGNGNGLSPTDTTYACGTISTGIWYHAACVRTGTTIKTFLNGTQQVSTAQGVTMVDGNKPLLIGRFQNGPTSTMFNGYIQDFRITKGVARYTGNFTAPTAAFPTL